MKFACPVPAPVTLPIVGSDARFPVRRIYCIGRNYTEHVREMGGDPKTSVPTIFTKSRETLVQSGAELPYPPNTENLHFEVELVVAIGEDGIFGYAAGLDMTRRDLQAAAKAKGGPWDRSKNFALSAPCGAITHACDVDISEAEIKLTRDGEMVQHSAINKMIWTVKEIIARLDEDMGLMPGDLIFTGTPDGVGPVTSGQKLEARITGLAPLSVAYI